MGRPEPAPLAEPWASMPGAESTSAELRRVREERDRAVAMRFKAEAAAGRLVDERDLARSELASARMELDALRTVRDQILRDLATERRLLAEAHDTIRALLARTELTEGAPMVHPDLLATGLPEGIPDGEAT